MSRVDVDSYGLTLKRWKYLSGPDGYDGEDPVREAAKERHVRRKDPVLAKTHPISP
jgi:hypothetical protein